MTDVTFGLGLPAAFWLTVFVLAMIVAAFARRRARTAIIFRHLGLIVRQNLPLPTALQSAANGETGATRRVLLRLARSTRMGMPLSQALAHAFPAVPGLPLSVVQAAERSGTLPSALGELNEHFFRRPEPAGSDPAHRWLLYCAVLVEFAVVYALMNFFVLPKFMVLSQRWDTPWPVVTCDIVRAAQVTGPAPQTALGHIFRLMVAGLTVLIPLFVVSGLARLRPRRADHVGAVSLVSDFIRWQLWPFRKLAWATCCARALPTLRLALAAGWTLPEAAERASEIDINYFGRRRLRGWAEQLREGRDAVAAGRTLGFPAMLLAQMALGMRDGQLSAPLYQAECYYRALETRWKLFFLQLLQPVAVLYLGALVGIFSAAVFFAVKDMIDRACTLVK